MIDYWTGYYYEGILGVGAGMKWANRHRVELPPDYERLDPQSYVICVYPAATQRFAVPTITLTIVNSYDHTKYENVVEVGIPKKHANFDAPVKIQFKYLRRMYVFASELFMLFTYCIRKLCVSTGFGKRQTGN